MKSWTLTKPPEQNSFTIYTPFIPPVSHQSVVPSNHSTYSTSQIVFRWQQNNERTNVFSIPIQPILSCATAVHASQHTCMYVLYIWGRTRDASETVKLLIYYIMVMLCIPMVHRQFSLLDQASSVFPLHAAVYAFIYSSSSKQFSYHNFQHECIQIFAQFI